MTAYAHRLATFESVVDEYDIARPSYPAGVFEALGAAACGLIGKSIADVGAGTGIATRQLIAHGGTVVACEPGFTLLQRARSQGRQCRAVVAAGEALPLVAGSMDLVCFAQSWHWVDQEIGAEEAARVLRPKGFWAAWWSHPWADDQEWFVAYQALLEGRCAGYSRHQRDVDWGSSSIAASGKFEATERQVVPWVRRTSVVEWVIELQSHSYVVGLDPDTRACLIGDVEGHLSDHFPDGAMSVAYETRLWMARRR